MMTLCSLKKFLIRYKEHPHLFYMEAPPPPTEVKSTLSLSQGKVQVDAKLKVTLKCSMSDYPNNNCFRANHSALFSLTNCC